MRSLLWRCALILAMTCFATVLHAAEYSFSTNSSNPVVDQYHATGLDRPSTAYERYPAYVASNDVILPASEQYDGSRGESDGSWHSYGEPVVPVETVPEVDKISDWGTPAQTGKVCGKGGCTGCSVCGCGGFYIGVEATFLAPNVARSQFVVDADASLVDFDVFNYETDVDYFNVAPRLWLGYKGPRCWGLQVRYWQMTNAADFLDEAYDPTFFDERISAATSSSLKMHTVDVEGTRDFCLGRWDMFATFGVRNGSFEQHDSVSTLTFLDNLALFDTYNQDAFTLRDFHGTGLTFSLAGSRCLGRHFSVFWSLRGSTLWGENRATASNSVVGSYLFAPNTANLDIDSDRDIVASDEVLFIGEIQTGLRCECDVRGFNARAFGQIAFEYQYWNANSSNAVAVAGADNGVISSLASVAATNDLDMSLVGCTLSAGFVW